MSRSETRRRTDNLLALARKARRPCVDKLRGGREILKVAAILGLVILLVYGDVAFLGFTLSPALYSEGVLANGTQYDYNGRRLYTSAVLDPLATGGAMWPVYQLISQRLLAGRFPLWNPYQGTGVPLAADTTWSTYFPIDLLYFAPNAYWDYVWLLKLWAAAMLCYLFLKKLGLSVTACAGGGLAYSLSGAFIWNPFVPWTDIGIMTPALLLVVKRCFDRPLSRMSIALASIFISVSLLGAHIEALIIQFLFVGWFAVFEVITRKKARMSGTLTLLAGIIFGLGLAAFFLLPVLEYLFSSPVGHGAGTGLHSLSSDGNPATYWVTLFVPYFYGFLQTYPYSGLRQVFFWDIFPGYLGTTVFFLSLLPLFSGDLSLRDGRGKYFSFFFVSEILILMKVFGVPPVNWIGDLPVLTYVIFSRYSGSILAMSFAGACAYGLERVLKPVKWSSAKALFAVALSIVPVAWITVPSPVSPSTPYFSTSLANLAFSMGALALASCLASKGGDKTTRTLVALIVLELAAYVPRSLSPGYEAVRAATLAAAGLIIVSLTLLPKMVFTASRLPHARLPSRKQVLVTVFVIALILQFAIASASPQGLPNRYDAFTPAPYVRFLQANSGFQRVFSPDGVFFPPVAGVFSVQNLGEFSAFMPSSFQDFVMVNLDRGALSTAFVGNGWVRNNRIGVGDEIRENMAMYSLLGVKYFVTSSTDLNFAHTVMLEPIVEGSHSWAPLGNRTVSTQFVTDLPFDGIYVRIGTYDRINHGDIVLVLDSVPSNPALHRETRIRADSIANGAPNLFSFERVDVERSTVFRITLSQSDTRVGNELAVLWWPQVKDNPHLTIPPGYLKIALGTVSRDPSLPIAYRDENATIYQNTRAFPRAFLVNRVIVADTMKEALLKTRDLGWTTRDTLVAESPPPGLPFLNASASEFSAVAEINKYSPQEVIIRVAASGASFLVLTDTFYPGWNAYVDGKPVTIYRAYGLVRAVFLTTGIHEASFKYEPNSFKLGGAITFVSAIIVTLLLLPSTRPFKNRAISRAPT